MTEVSVATACDARAGGGRRVEVVTTWSEGVREECVVRETRKGSTVHRRLHGPSTHSRLLRLAQRAANSPASDWPCKTPQSQSQRW